MALQGTLETFALADVLRLLASTKKTGVLRLDGDRGHGELSVVDGELVDAAASGAPRAQRPAEVLFELLRFDDGSFVFDTDAEASGAHRDNVDEALADAEEQLREWREIEAVIPSPTRVLRLVSDREREITLSARQWSAVVAIGSGRTSLELGERLGLAELPATRLARDLVELGAVKVAEESAPVHAPEPFPEPTEEPPAPSPAAEIPAAAAAVDTTVTDPPPPAAPEPAVEPPPVVQSLIPPPPGGVAPAAAGSGSFADAPSLIGEDQTPSPNGTGAAFAPPQPSPAFAPPLEESDPISSWNDDPDDGLSSFHQDDEVSPFGPGEGPGPDDPFGPDPFTLPKSGGLANAEDADEAAEMARQLARLSPRAQQAVAAAAAANTDEEREQAIARVADDSDEPINRNLLLKYLSSVDE